MADVPVSADAAAVDWVAPHCDLVDRLANVPPNARMRGLWFKVIETEVKKHGHWAEYRRWFPDDAFRSLSYYWTGDYLVRAAVAGALIAGAPELLHTGMHEFARANAASFAGTLFGRTLLKLLSPDPVNVVRQGIAARRQTLTHGHWRLGRTEPGLLEVELTEEYVWIESLVTGATLGTFDAIGVEAEVVPVLTDRFNGKVVCTYQPRGG